MAGGPGNDQLAYKLKNMYYTSFSEFLPNHEESIAQKRLKLRMAKWRTNRPGIGSKGQSSATKKHNKLSVSSRLQNIAAEALKSAKIRRIERMESNMKKGSSITQFFSENASIKKSFQALKTKMKSQKSDHQPSVSFGGIDRSKTITKEPKELTEEQIMSFK